MLYCNYLLRLAGFYNMLWRTVLCSCICVCMSMETEVYGLAKYSTVVRDKECESDLLVDVSE